MHRKVVLLGIVSLVAAPLLLLGDTPKALRTGVAEHAFDHLGGVSNLASTAVASGSTVIYCNGVGAGYLGLPEEKDLARWRKESLAYLKEARAEGIQLAIGYVCATSIVNLNAFDKNWTPEFRARFHSKPAQWRQLDKTGKVLISWYALPYEPACMNNPDWRTFERFMVRQQLESGCDGIFFDNPTVHPNGCYCQFCMEKFDAFLAAKSAAHPKEHSFESLRQWAIAHPVDFLEFRSTIAADFMADMRSYARTVKSHALITCNNSLNSPDVLFSQCRAMGYNINELSKAEDFVVLEDMSTEARKLADGRIIEYGPTYKQIHAISHQKPIVACTLADADYYNTLPHLARLSMAEAAANDASWMLWPGWPENLRKPMASIILPQADFLRSNEKLLNNTEPRCDVLLFLCFRRWLQTDQCAALPLATALMRENIQFAVKSEEDLHEFIKHRGKNAPVLLVESLAILNDAEKRTVDDFQKTGGRVVTGDTGDWLAKLKRDLEKPSLSLQAPATVRTVIRDQRNRAIVHFYNLNIEKMSATEDRVHPAENVRATVRVPFKRVHSVRALSADGDTLEMPVNAKADGMGAMVTFTLPRLAIATIVVIE